MERTGEVWFRFGPICHFTFTQGRKAWELGYFRDLRETKREGKEGREATGGWNEILDGTTKAE